MKKIFRNFRILTITLLLIVQCNFSMGQSNAETQRLDWYKEMVTETGCDLRTIISLEIHYAKRDQTNLDLYLIKNILTNYENWKNNYFAIHNNFELIDSLFSFVYIVKNNYFLLNGDASFKAKEKRRITNWLKKAEQELSTVEITGFYEYLKIWLIDKRDISESEAILVWLKDQFDIEMKELVSYEALNAMLSQHNLQHDSYHFDKKMYLKNITSYRMSAAQALLDKDTTRSFLYFDSTFKLGVHLDKTFPKKLAIKSQNIEWYHHFLSLELMQSPTFNLENESKWPYTNNETEKEFVLNAMKSFEFDKTILPVDLLLYSNRYAELHDFCSNYVIGSKNIVSILLLNKRSVYSNVTSLVKSSYVEYPEIIKFYTINPAQFNKSVIFGLNYINTHLVQYNSINNFYAEGVYDDYFKFLYSLVGKGLYDVEDYFYYLDWYNTSILKQPSQYGHYYKLRNYEESTGIVTNPTIEENRKKENLLPIELYKMIN